MRDNIFSFESRNRQSLETHDGQKETTKTVFVQIGSQFHSILTRILQCFSFLQ